jgi:pimeloyl-ACP methyl ester carboxylesterase
MAIFVLVHGSSGGGWVWQKLAPILRASGHQVYTPTLTGLSDRAHLLNCGVNLTTHITDVANLLWYEDLSDVILVGNSYAGMVITGVAAKVPERLKLVIYLDAYVPADGQNEADLLPPPMRAAREADAAAHGGLTEPPPPAIFGITDPALAEWVKARSTPHPWSTYAEPVPAGSARSAALRRVFIHCTVKPPTTPDLFASSAAKARTSGWPVHELRAGHLAMLTAPRELAALLQQVSEEASG